MKFKIISLFFILNSLVAFSQKKVTLEYADTPLKNVLVEIENKFEVRFSFNSKLVENQFIYFSKKSSTLLEIIEAIELQSTVVFEKINERYYILVLQNDSLLSLQQLDKVIITDYITLGIQKKKSGAITLRPEKLGILPGLTEPDVLESLQVLPGIQSPNETASGLYIRGGTPDQNTVLWDGIKMYNSGHFFGMLSIFNPYITKEIKLFKSGTEARYGNHVSGVLDIKSPNNIPQKTKGGFGFNMTHADAYLKTPIGKKTGIILSARRSFTDVLETFTFNKLSERVFQNIKINQENLAEASNASSQNDNTFYFVDYTAKVISSLSDTDKLVLSGLFTKNTLDNNYKVPEFQDESKDMLDIKNKGFSVSWQKAWSPNFSHNLMSYYSRFDFDYLGTNTYSNTFTEKSIKQNNIKELGFSLHTDWKINEKTNLFSGYQFSSNDVEYLLKYIDFSEQPTLQNQRSYNNLHALFTEYQYSNDKISINLGLRGNYFSVVKKLFLEPRFFFETKLNSLVNLKVSAEIKNQGISQIVEFETAGFGFGLENQLWALANETSIPIQKSNQVSTGLVFQKNNLKIDVDLFYKNLKGLTSLTRGYNDQTTDFSKGKNKVFGVDFLLTKKIGQYRTWISYSYINNRVKFEDFENEYFPANSDITHYFSWAHSYKWNNLELSLGWKYRTGIPYTNSSGITETNDSIIINLDKINGKRLPDYHRLDLSAIYKFKLAKKSKWQGVIGASLLNIYNRKNNLKRTFNARPVINNSNVEYHLQEVNKYSIGLTPNIVLRFNF